MPPSRFRPLSLPHVPLAQQLTANLVADPVTPDPRALVATTSSVPSLLRRARIVRDGAHFSYVSPLPIAFPYEFLPMEDGEDAASSVERHLRLFDPKDATAHAFAPGRQHAPYPSARMVAFSPQAHAACVPHLDVGDTHEWVGSTSGTRELSSGPGVSADASHMWGDGGEDAAGARRALSDWASGRAFSLDLTEPVHDDDGAGVHFLKREEGPENKKAALSALYKRTSYGPWSLRYGGHQFGEWAGQLGDGRTVSLVETLHPESGKRMELQLKGAGRTPYSRFADGLATLKSSVREFLVSEYMAALGIPTSYSLCVTSLPKVPVIRERPTTAALNMRMAPSWLRIGNFELHSILGEWESVRVLGEYVSREIFGWSDVTKGEGEERPPWALRLVRSVGERNAHTFALWQAYGFMHGVINTDNIALTGDTIDYGPYAFMDAIDEDEICNHTDIGGRYSYRLQPTMLVYAMDRLFSALSPIIGFEDTHGHAPKPGELLGVSEKDILMWADHAASKQDEVRKFVQDTLLGVWAKAWAKRLGLSPDVSVDRLKSELVDPFFTTFAGLDMSRTLRVLCDFNGDISAWAQRIVEDAKTDAPHAGPDDVAKWLTTYAAWRNEVSKPADQIAAEMRRANPRFVLRNWVTEHVAERLEEDDDTALLERVRAMCAAPFEAYADGEAAKLCEVGDLLRTNVPSCSS